MPCAYKKALEEQKITFIREQAKKRAIASGTNYAIYMDEEDNRLATVEFKTAVARGYRILELVQGFEPTT